MEFVANISFMRGKSIEELGTLAKTIGLQGIELPLMPGFPCDVPQVAENLPAMVRQLREDFDVDVPIVMHSCDASAPEAEAVYDACAKADVRFVQPAPFDVQGNDWWGSFGTAVSAARSFGRLSERYGVKTLIPLHHGNSLFTTCIAGWAVAKECDPDFVCVRVDPAYLVISGENYEVGLDIIKGYLGVIGVANCVYRPHEELAQPGLNPEISFVCLEDGIVSWQRVMQFLRSIGYEEILCFESIYDDHHTGEKLAGDLRYLQAMDILDPVGT